MGSCSPSTTDLASQCMIGLNVLVGPVLSMPAFVLLAWTAKLLPQNQRWLHARTLASRLPSRGSSMLAAA